MKLFRFLILCFFLYGCGATRSGGYIQYFGDAKLKKLASKFGVSVSEIKRANKSAQFRKGQWIFIPTKKGIASQFYRSRNSYDFKQLKNISFIWPVPTSKRISSHYKSRSRPDHLGVDIPAKRGAHVLAAADGKVFYAGRGLRGYGNLVIIKHGKDLFTVYAHAEKNYVKKGQKVYQGQVISKVGSTGRSTGPHLHFEIRVGDKAINPLPYLDKSKRLANLP